MADLTLVLCQRCGTAPRQPHPNAKYCLACRAARDRAPASHLTPEQAAQVERLAGTMLRREIAQQVGVSQTQVHRYLREQGITSNVRDYPPDVVTAVCTAYATLGRVRTQALFPDVSIRSIIDHYFTGRYPPRQVRWTGEQLIDAVRMAGLVSHNAQARYFGRPNAYDGSITKLWGRVFRCAPTDVHGLGACLAWRLCTPGVGATLVQQQTMPGLRTLVLWLDLAGHLRADVAPEIREAVQTLAAFQRWLFDGGSSVEIRRMITQREDAYGNTSRV